MNYLFDLYGTLIKSDGSGYGQIFATLFDEGSDFYKSKIRVFVSTNHFDSTDEVFKALEDHVGRQILQNKRQQFEECMSEWMRSHTLFEDTLEVLTTLKDKGSKIGIVSNASSYIERMLDDFSLREQVDFVIQSHRLGCVKPDKLMYSSALEKLNCLPNQVTMIGDQLTKDVLPPIALGMQGILFDPENKSKDYQGRRIQFLKELIY